VVQAIDTARRLAEELLAGPLARRWQHVQAVAKKAEQVADAVPPEDRETLVAAAWLHDIGYGPGLTDTGFHPLDGARFLRRIGASDRVARLVAHHSCAVYEARVRGLERELLGEFKPEESVTYDALVFCDMTTGPSGAPVAFQDRMDEIARRYGPDHEVTKALHLARHDLTMRCERICALLAERPDQPM
jgi:putative nucleotidyltransferase with HDIG domain